MIERSSVAKDEDAIAIDKHLNAIREIVSKRRSTQLTVWFTTARHYFDETLLWKEFLKTAEK